MMSHRVYIGVIIFAMLAFIVLLLLNINSNELASVQSKGTSSFQIILEEDGSCNIFERDESQLFSDEEKSVHASICGSEDNLQGAVSGIKLIGSGVELKPDSVSLRLKGDNDVEYYFNIYSRFRIVTGVGSSTFKNGSFFIHEEGRIRDGSDELHPRFAQIVTIPIPGDEISPTKVFFDEPIYIKSNLLGGPSYHIKDVSKEGMSWYEAVKL